MNSIIKADLVLPVPEITLNKILPNPQKTMATETTRNVGIVAAKS